MEIESIIIERQIHNRSSSFKLWPFFVLLVVCFSLITLLFFYCSNSEKFTIEKPTTLTTKKPVIILTEKSVTTVKPKTVTTTELKFTTTTLGNWNPI